MTECKCHPLSTLQAHPFEAKDGKFEPRATVLPSLSLSQFFNVFMKKWLVWLIVGGPVLVYAIGRLLTRY
jgi:hypothetical protein